MAIKVDLVRQIIELIKILPNSFIKIWLTLLTICVFILSTILLKNGSLNQYLINKIMLSYKAQKIAVSFNHQAQLVMDELILKAEEKLKGRGECLFEYIDIEASGVENVKYSGYVMFARKYDKELKKSIESREKSLLKTLRDFYYSSYSRYMEQDIKNHPFGTVASVVETIKRDDQNNTIMQDTFTKNNGTHTGNFIFEVNGLGYSYIKNEENIIIGHPVILCDKEAFEILGRDVLLNLINEFHSKMYKILFNGESGVK